jgi:hypothetical protein
MADPIRTPPINKQPNGLLGFLGIKNGGRNPSTLAEILSPTLDLAQLYYASYVEYVQNNLIITGLGPFFALGTPNNESWYVDSFGVRSATLATGDALNYGLARISASGNEFTPLMSDMELDGVPGQRLYRAVDRGLVITSGETLGIYVTAWAGAPIAATATACITRLPQ